MRAEKNGGEAIIILMQRLNRIVLIIVGLVAALAIFGVNVKTTLAGLGIGGLAIALAAQKSLENLIGGVSLLIDKAVRIGDFCQIGDQLGTVEDIGLRSLKLRTMARICPDSKRSAGANAVPKHGASLKIAYQSNFLAAH
jgi:MscS family membrane protein